MQTQLARSVQDRVAKTRPFVEALARRMADLERQFEALKDAMWKET